MTFTLDHTEVPALDRVATAKFWSDVLGLPVGVPQGRFERVRVNDTLTLDVADHADPWKRNHYAFHVSDEEFDAVLNRVQSAAIPFGSGPHAYEDGKINTRDGGRGFYFLDPNGHLLELITVAETKPEGPRA